MSDASFSGGCQCGAIRFSAAAPFGRASLCHCRMCQKAFAGPVGALVSADGGVRWTRGQPRYFQSSNRVRRGFCADCGTPLSFEPLGGVVELAIAAFDDADAFRPVVQLAHDERIAWFDQMAGLPTTPEAELAPKAAYYASIQSNQHPDHDTENWPA